jgi:hypothetical protein
MNDFMALTLLRQGEHEMQLAAERRRLLGTIKGAAPRTHATLGPWHRLWVRFFHQTPPLRGSTNLG